MSNILKQILPRALQATGSPTDLESTWAQQEALPPPVAVVGPAGPMPQLSMERLRPPQWHHAIVEAVATARQAFSGTYEPVHKSVPPREGTGY